MFPPARFPVGAAGILATSIRSRSGPGRISIALAGGSTPQPVYTRLARIPALPWRRIEIFFSDERRVPPEDPASNFRMVRSALLRHVGVLPHHVHRLRGEAEDPEAEARRYEEALPARLDLLLLGVGVDGHTASLFPHHAAVRERRRRVLALEGPAEPRGRFTLAPPALASARRLIVLAAGSSKADAVHRALAGAWDPDACPAQLARRGTWILDEKAARRLDSEPCRQVGRPGPCGESRDPAVSA